VANLEGEELMKKRVALAALSLLFCTHIFTMQNPPKKLACIFCKQKKTSMNRCKQCKNALYCSRECQINHWPKHREVCRKKSDDPQDNPLRIQTKRKKMHKHATEPSLNEYVLEIEKRKSTCDTCKQKNHLLKACKSYINAYYCSKECQIKDKPKHEKICEELRILDSQFDAAFNIYQLRSYLEAIEYFEKFLETKKEKYTNPQINTKAKALQYKAMYYIARSYHELKKYECAINMHQKLLTTIEQESPNNPKTQTLKYRAMYYITHAYLKLKQYKNALQMFQEILKTMEHPSSPPASSGREAPNTPKMKLIKYCLIYDKAMVCFHRHGPLALKALENLVAIIEQEKSDTFELELQELKRGAIRYIPIIYLNLGQYELAIAAYQKLLTVIHLYGPPIKYEALFNMATSYHNLKQYENAIEVYEQFLEKTEEIDWPRILAKRATVKDRIEMLQKEKLNNQPKKNSEK